MRKESEIMRHEGDALISTGSMINKQAELLDFYVNKREQVAAQNRDSVFKKVQPSIQLLNPDPTQDQPLDFTEKPISEKKDDFCFPIYSSMQKFETAKELDEVLKETLEEIENTQNTYVPVIKEEIKQEVIEVQESPDYNIYKSELMATPYLKLTIEESKSLDKMFTDTKILLKRTCPVSLYQARVGYFLNTLDLEGMLSIFVNSRRAQNNYHFMTMMSMPYFEDLTTR